MAVVGQGEFELIHYETPDYQADFVLDPTNETIWATQAQMASAFGVTPSTVRGHLASIFQEGELERAAVEREFRSTGPDGKLYNYLQFNLDAIIAVGYRIGSKQGTAFRRWATSILKDYIIQGFALDEQRLRDDPTALRELAAKIRALRADEKNIYGAVRDVFAFGSSDYDATAKETRTFFASLQDRFTYAITGQQSAEVLLERANHLIADMGLRTMSSDRPSAGDAVVAKNYLDNDELYALHILCEQFLLFVESRALRGQKLTMAALSQKFDDLIRLQGHPVFSGYKLYIAQKAKTHALVELERYRNRIISERQSARLTIPPGPNS